MALATREEPEKRSPVMKVFESICCRSIVVLAVLCLIREGHHFLTIRLFPKDCLRNSGDPSLMALIISYDYASKYCSLNTSLVCITIIGI